MTEILLIQPPIHDFYLTQKRTIPYGLASIAASLIQEGFSVDILDALATSKSRILEYPDEMADLKKFYGRPDISPFGLFHRFRHFGYSFQHIGQAARRSGAYLVGVSALFTPYIEEAIETAQTVKAFHPRCKVVLGGHHPTVFPEAVFKSGAVDFVLRGEGEASMPQLAKALKKGLPIRSVPGIVFREDDGSFRIGEPAITECLDENPLPAAHLIKQTFYRRNERGSMAIMAGRGCPMTCSYCSVSAASCFKYRKRSVSSVIREIASAVEKHQIEFIDFEDENLSLDREWFLRLLKEYSNRFKGKSIELRAMNGLFPPSIDGEVIQAMKEAGFRTLNLSLGSISKTQLKRFHRPDVTGAFDKALSWAEHIGLNAVGYIIIGAPYQSAESSLQDLLFLAQRRVLAGVSVFYPSPGSADYGLCEKENLLPASFSLMRSTALPIDHTTTRLESVTLLRLGRVVNFMKGLLDRGLEIPCAGLLPNNFMTDKADRIEIGIKLLASFFHDARLRGVTPDGDVYQHLIQGDLCEKFVEGVGKIRMRGCL